MALRISRIGSWSHGKIIKNIYNRRTKIMNLYITLKVIKFWHHIWKSYIWHERACFSVVLWKVHQFRRFDSLLMALRSLINFENKSFFSLRGQVSVSNLIGGDFLTFFPSIVNFLTPIFKEYFKIITVKTSQNHLFYAQAELRQLKTWKISGWARRFVTRISRTTPWCLN